MATLPVWQYFGFKADEDNKAKPACKLCLKKVSASGGNTSQTFNGISVTIILRRHKRSGNKPPNVDNQQLRKASHQFSKHSPKCKDINSGRLMHGSTLKIPLNTKMVIKYQQIYILERNSRNLITVVRA